MSNDQIKTIKLKDFHPLLKDEKGFLRPKQKITVWHGRKFTFKNAQGKEVTGPLKSFIKQFESEVYNSQIKPSEASLLLENVKAFRDLDKGQPATDAYNKLCCIERVIYYLFHKLVGNLRFNKTESLNEVETLFKLLIDTENYARNRPTSGNPNTSPSIPPLDIDSITHDDARVYHVTPPLSPVQTGIKSPHKNEIIEDDSSEEDSDTEKVTSASLIIPVPGATTKETSTRALLYDRFESVDSELYLPRDIIESNDSASSSSSEEDEETTVKEEIHLEDSQVVQVEAQSSPKTEVRREYTEEKPDLNKTPLVTKQSIEQRADDAKEELPPVVESTVTTSAAPKLEAIVEEKKEESTEEKHGEFSIEETAVTTSAAPKLEAIVEEKKEEFTEEKHGEFSLEEGAITTPAAPKEESKVDEKKDVVTENLEESYGEESTGDTVAVDGQAADGESSQPSAKEKRLDDAGLFFEEREDTKVNAEQT